MTHSKNIIYIDMDNTLCDYATAFLKRRRSNPDVEFPQSMPGFFLELSPLPGAVETFKWLDAQPQFEVYILTSPSIKNPMCYTEKRLWVEVHLGFAAVDRLIISKHKNLNKGNFLIDDRDAGQGQERFEGELIKFGSDDFSDWQAVCTYFEGFLSKDGAFHTTEKLDANILCFRAFDLRNRFEEPVETFREALELIQSERAYLPEMSGDIVCYLKNGQTISVPESFYLVSRPRFASREEAESWVHERADKIESGEPVAGLSGIVIADPRLPIGEQIEQAAESNLVKVIDPSENDRVCAGLEVWLDAAIKAMPEVSDEDATSASRMRMHSAIADRPSNNSEHNEIDDDSHTDDPDVNECQEKDDLVEFLKDMQAKHTDPTRWVIACRDDGLTDIHGTAYFNMVHDIWVSDISDASFIKDRKLAESVSALFDYEHQATVVQHYIGQKELAKTAIKLEWDPKVITYHAESGTYLYEEHNYFSDFESHALLSLKQPEQFTITKNAAGPEQMWLSIPDTVMDEVSIAWCKHRKLHGALGGPVGKEYGAPDCDYD